jgi:hypothetical protein
MGDANLDSARLDCRFPYLSTNLEWEMVEVGHSAESYVGLGVLGAESRAIQG